MRSPSFLRQWQGTGSMLIGHLARQAERCRRHDRHFYSAATVLTFASILIAAMWAVTRFSLAWGEFLWMQRAFDEPYYLWNIALGDATIDSRLFGRLLGLLLLKMGVSFDVMAEAYALVVPVFVFAGALFLASTWESHPMARLIWALLLVCAFALLSGSDQVIYESAWPASFLSEFIGDPGLLKPDVMNFFLIFRRPEQQSSWIILFPYLAGAVGSFLTWRSQTYRIVCIFTPLLAIIYINVALIALMVFVCLSVLNILVYRRPIIIEFLMTLVLTGLTFSVVFFGASAAGSKNNTLFATHLPFLRPSIAFAALGLCWLAIQFFRTATFTGRNWLALVFFAVPIVFLNQQVVTGLAILPQNWELSGNYICIVVGFAMLLRPTPGLARPGLVKEIGLLVVWLCALVLLGRGQLINETQYTPSNSQSVAYAKVFKAAEAKAGKFDHVVLPHLWDESMFVTRVGPGVNVLGGYNWILANWPRRWNNHDDFGQHADKARINFEVGFETLARRGVTPEQFQASLEAEIRSGNCWPTLMYFFATQDCWPTFSNFTSPALKRLPSVVIPLVAMYQRYWQDKAIGTSGRRVLLILSEPLPHDDAAKPFRHTLLASLETTIRGSPVRAFAYAQSTP